MLFLRSTLDTVLVNDIDNREQVKHNYHIELIIAKVTISFKWVIEFSSWNISKFYHTIFWTILKPKRWNMNWFLGEQVTMSQSCVPRWYDLHTSAASAFRFLGARIKKRMLTNFFEHRFVFGYFDESKCAIDWIISTGRY